MSQVKVKVNRKAVAALLKSSEVQSDLRSRAGKIAASAGDGFEARTSTGRTRARSAVITTTPKARQNQRKLLQAIWAGR